MDLKLKGLAALVTGASQGLGYAVALGLAREGARVAVNSRSADKLEAAAERIRQETGGQVIALSGDVGDPVVCQQIVTQAVSAFGGLDLLLTNAGGPPAGKFEQFDDATWQKAVDLSLMSHVRLIRAALPHLRRSQAASVLTVTSVSAKQPIANLVLSNSVRLATVGLTKSLALEVGAEGVRFNSILPGWTETERVGVLMNARAQANGTTPEQELTKQIADNPLGRMAQPDEFANVAVFMLSPAASYLNGAMLSVDGGAYKGIF